MHQPEGLGPALNSRHQTKNAEAAYTAPREGDVYIGRAPEGFVVRYWNSGQALSTHPDLLASVVACHAIAIEYGVSVWQEVDSEGNALPELRILYTRRSDGPSTA